MRFHSASIVRIHCARSGTSMPGEALDRDDPAQLVVERRQPVVAVHQHQDLPGVAVLGQLLGRAVHVADHRLGADDQLAVELEHHPEHAVGRRVLRPDVEDHLLGPKPAGRHDPTSTPPPRTIQCSPAAVKTGALRGVHRAPSLPSAAPRPSRPAAQPGRAADSRRHGARPLPNRDAGSRRSTRSCARDPGTARRRDLRPRAAEADARADPRGGAGRGRAGGRSRPGRRRDPGARGRTRRRRPRTASPGSSTRPASSCTRASAARRCPAAAARAAVAGRRRLRRPRDRPRDRRPRAAHRARRAAAHGAHRRRGRRSPSTTARRRCCSRSRRSRGARRCSSHAAS